jgi:hypothetical protein
MTLLMIEAIPIPDSAFVSSNISEAETGAAAWASGTTYAKGARCVSTTTHLVYESLKAANTGNDPTDPANTHNGNPDDSPAGKWWVVVYPTARWRVFDQSLLYPVQDTVNLRWAVAPPSRINAVALFGVIGSTVKVEVLPAAGGAALWTQTVAVSSSGQVGVAGWTNAYGRLEYPLEAIVLDIDHIAYQQVQVTVQASGGALRQISEIVMGEAVTLGTALAGTSAGYRDRSSKDEDYFGNRRIVKRAAGDTASYSVSLPRGEVDRTLRLIRARRVNPAVFLTLDRDAGPMIFGYPADPAITFTDGVRATYQLDVDQAT